MLSVSDLDILRTYIDGVMQRAKHHTNVAAAVLTVAGGVGWRSDPDSLACRTYKGHTANILWFSVHKKPYALAYNHNTGQIELSDRTTSRYVAGFDNATPSLDVLTVFEAL